MPGFELVGKRKKNLIRSLKMDLFFLLMVLIILERDIE